MSRGRRGEKGREITDYCNVRESKKRCFIFMCCRKNENNMQKNKHLFFDCLYMFILFAFPQ